MAGKRPDGPLYRRKRLKLRRATADAFRMHGSRRGVVALVVVLTASLAAPAAAFAKPGSTPITTHRPTSTTKPPGKRSPSTTTTTIDPKSVPPPPPFALPIDYGLKLLAQRDQANLDLLSASAALPHDKAKAKVMQQQWVVLQRRLARLRVQIRHTQHDLDIAHQSLQEAGVEAYMNSGSSRLTFQ